MDFNIFSFKSILKMRKASMRRKFIAFSVVLYLTIFLFGSAVFLILMGRIVHTNAVHDLSLAMELERSKLEASINGEVALVLKMASSPWIQRYFLEPSNKELQKMAYEDIAVYRRFFTTGKIFWASDLDKEFYYDDGAHYTIDPYNPESYWYNATLYRTEKFNFNINYNTEIQATMFWINAPVFDSEHKPIGIVGCGVDLSKFVNGASFYKRDTLLYFFNSAGEITGAADKDLITNKINIKQELGRLGEQIFHQIYNLKDDEIQYFEFDSWNSGAVLGRVPALDWYVTAVLPFTVTKALKTDVTILFLVVMMLIAAVFVVFNLFVVGLLEPVTKMIKTMNQMSADWDMKELNDEAETLGTFLKLAIKDPLTGIYNRRFMDGSLKKIIKTSSRMNDKLSVLMIDIDYFKKYNDTYGHDKGDNCLKIIADILRRSVNRDDDFTARYGGEEFIVVLPNTDEEGAKNIADKLLEKIRKSNIPHEKSDIADFVTVSIGGATSYVKYTQTGMDYIKRADEALYISKKEGRNRYTFCDF